MLLACFLYAGYAQADETQCIDLTQLNEVDLAAHSFDGTKGLTIADQLQRDRVYVAGEVRIVVQPIFNPTDPAENHTLYRWANRLHVQTRAGVIRQAILFRTGEPVRVASILESERVLRAKPYLYDARTIPRRLCGDRLDIDVVVRDVWTLLPEADFSRSGGDNSYAYGLTDTNLLGTGRTLSMFFEKDPDREGVGVFFQDPNVGGSRIVLETRFEDNSDGSRRVIDVGQPFYSLDARRALGTHLEETNQEQGLYLFGNKFAEFAQDFRLANVVGGISNGEIEGHTWRWRAGFNYEEHEFSAIKGAIPPDPLPENRTFAYPWIGFSSIEDNFDTTVNVDRIDRTEDLDLGRQYNMLIGWSDSAFGGDDDRRLVLQSDFRDGSRRGGKHLLFYGMELSGFWNFELDRSEQVVARTYLTYRQQQTGRFSLAATIDGTVVHNLYSDQQLLGGGDSGLRGYPSRYQWGNRSYLVSLEQRYFSDIYIARIVRVGFAAFFDAGRTWFSDGPGGDGFGTLANVGFGFRFVSTRTRQDRMLHLDFAFPLVDGPDAESMQVLLVVKEYL